MDEQETVRIALELECESEPIMGRIRVSQEPEVEFAGVLELLGLLDDARHRH